MRVCVCLPVVRPVVTLIYIIVPCYAQHHGFQNAACRRSAVVLQQMCSVLIGCFRWLVFQDIRPN